MAWVGHWRYPALWIACLLAHATRSQWQEIATWQETLKERPDLSAKTVAFYTQDARRFATWLQQKNRQGE
jgi:hypothetical protein